MMDAITRDGNGAYFDIDAEREGWKVFPKNLTGILITIAKDVKIQVEFNPANPAKPGLAAAAATEDRAEFVGLVKKLAAPRERKFPAPAEVVPADR